MKIGDIIKKGEHTYIVATNRKGELILIEGPLTNGF